MGVDEQVTALLTNKRHVITSTMPSDTKHFPIPMETANTEATEAKEKYFSPREVLSHSQAENCWIVVDGAVYDVPVRNNTKITKVVSKWDKSQLSEFEEAILQSAGKNALNWSIILNSFSCDLLISSLPSLH